MTRFFSFLKSVAIGAFLTIASSEVADAGQVDVTSDITTSTTWTSDNTYNLRTQIFVRNGASLTIEAGTVIASEGFGGIEGGGLAVTRGSKIYIMGTEGNPVIFTSQDDVATWEPDSSHPTGKNPKTGSWRESANEWGNLTIMGRGYISEDAVAGNIPTCSAGNKANMEGLIASFPGDPNIQYGGGDDDDDSGVIRFTSIRFAGRVVGLNNELNGLSMGGVGRGTDVHHVEIMNNVDDGIEVWGGAANYKFLNIWNVGDDSLDIDQGWRGKAQFGLIVQGHSLDDSQGSGVGDNCIEHDGAENSDWQPVTTSRIENFTMIGQPVDGDGGTAWRDNCRMQYRRCVWMDLGERLVRYDNLDGDGAQGYGFNNTLSWENTWTTDFDGAPAHPNDCPPGIYEAQTDGKLAEIRDSVFFRNLAGDAYTEATARGVFDASNENVLIPGFDQSDAPIKSIQRGPAVNRGGKTMLPVISLDPRANNEAVASAGTTTGDDFFQSVDFRGGFSSDRNWLLGWSAADAFGFLEDGGTNPTVYCDPATVNSTGGAGILTSVSGYGTSEARFLVTGVPAQPGILFTGPNQIDQPFGCGRRCVGGAGVLRYGPFNVGAGASTSFNVTIDMTDINQFSGTVNTNVQYWFRDPDNASDCGVTFNLTNALSM